MKVVIHAGIHRTGTTTLQHFMAGNREVLAARGIGYPGKMKSHQKLAWALKRGDARARDVLSLLQSTGDAETTVLSGEDFCILQNLKWLKSVSKNHEVRAVFYLRRQDHWLMSWYNQHIKWPFARSKSQMDSRTFLTCLHEFHWLDFATLLERWSAVLGQESVAVGVVEHGQVEDVVEDFLARLCVTSEGLDRGPARVNDSLPVHVLEIARHLGLADMSPQQRTRLLTALRQGLADKAQAAKTVFAPEERLGILEQFAAPNREVAQRFFDREALFFESPPEPNEPYFRFPDLPRQELMREWVAPVIHQLLRTGKI